MKNIITIILLLSTSFVFAQNASFVEEYIVDSRDTTQEVLTFKVLDSDGSVLDFAVPQQTNVETLRTKMQKYADSYVKPTFNFVTRKRKKNKR